MEGKIDFVSAAMLQAKNQDIWLFTTVKVRRWIRRREYPLQRKAYSIYVELNTVEPVTQRLQNNIHNAWTLTWEFKVQVLNDKQYRSILLVDSRREKGALLWRRPATPARM